MLSYKSIPYNLNRFFKEIHLKKQYLKKVQNKARVLSKLKEENYKQVKSHFFRSQIFSSDTLFVMYIIEISFSKKNTLFHVSDFAGNVKFFCSAGSFQKKKKRARSKNLQKFYRVLQSKLKFVKKVPIAVHFKNVNSNMFWFLKKLKKKFFITVVKHFARCPYNGCRKRKIRRKKFKGKS